MLFRSGYPKISGNHVLSVFHFHHKIGISHCKANFMGNDNWTEHSIPNVVLPANPERRMDSVTFMPADCSVSKTRPSFSEI